MEQHNTHRLLTRFEDGCEASDKHEGPDRAAAQAKVPPSAFRGVAAGVAQGLAPCTGALLTFDNSENALQPIEL
jgi:hypothetical protein